MLTLRTSDPERARTYLQVNGSTGSMVYQAQVNLVRHVVRSLGHHLNLVWEVANEAMDHLGDYVRTLLKGLLCT